MNILVPDSWLKEYLKTKATYKQIAEALTLHSATVERSEKIGKDYVYEIEITGNRIDMAGVVGIAREAAVALTNMGIEAKFHGLNPKTPQNPKKELLISIINNPKLCRRILAVVLANVSIRPSPDALKNRLEISGIRSINNLVDITNYVMLETGHPTHIFDYDRLTTKKLVIRESKAGEGFTSFEGKSYTLEGGDIVIDDGRGAIIDLPGIIGAKNSVVTDKTKNALFFIENNDPMRIRQTSMRHGIHTYAANINKNKPDSELAKTAMLRGIQLYKRLASAIVSSKIIDLYGKPHKPNTVTVAKKKIDQYLGISLSSKKINNLLVSLGFETTYRLQSGAFSCRVPSWRADDVKIAEDIIEEVARIYGYHNIQSRVLLGYPVINREDAKQTLLEKTKHALKHWGFTEIYGSPLVSEQLLKSMNFNPEKCIKLKNALTEDAEYMRPSLLPTLISAVKENKQRTNKQLRLFELARVYIPSKSNLPREPLMLSFSIRDEKMKKGALFYEVKGVVEALFLELGIETAEFTDSGDQSCPVHKLMSGPEKAQITLNKKAIGLIGKIGDALYADLDFESLAAHASSKKSYTPIPKYPPIIEDITLLFPKKTFVVNVMNIIQNTDTLIRHVELIDSYKNSHTFRITFQSSKRNLTEMEIGEIKKRIATALDRHNITV